jgi:SAM-dependent methyltransferase
MSNVCAFCGLETLKENKFVRANSWKGIRKYWYCKFCSGYTLLPALNDADMADLYQNYYNNTDVDESFSSIKSKFVDLEEYLRTNTRVETILDFGCGIDGYLPSLSGQYQKQIDGYEVSSKTISLLQAKFPSNTFYDPTTFVFSKVKYDLVVLSDVLEHLSEPRELLVTLKTRLKPDGQIWIQQPLENNLTIFSLTLKIWAFLSKTASSKIPPFHVSLGSKKSLTKLIDVSDFEIITYKISETIWPAPPKLNFFNLKNFCLTSIKYLDFFISFVIKDYGTRSFFLIRKRIRENE